MIKMRLSLVPVLLLATVAFSSSNVLPMLSINQQDTVGLNSQENDNIFSNNYHYRNKPNDILYTISIAAPQINKNQQLYVNNDNNRPDYKSNIFNKEYTYNGEGFRKEQWHNYPRQLDRLHKYLYDHYSVDKRNLDPDDPNDYSDDIPQTSPDNEINTSEFQVTTHEDNGYKTVLATNPFLIFKIRLACLKDKLRDTNKYTDTTVSEPEYIPGNKDDTQYKEAINPEVSVTKVKREEVNDLQNDGISENSMTKNRAVKKRIFSLWSRLQSFNHKGHELQHRRHLHAYYGLPDGDGGGVLTAETRATFMRPPGSPLRWG